METEKETDDKRLLSLVIKLTYEGAAEMTDATSDEAILYEIALSIEEVEVEIGEEFEVPLNCEAEYEETLRIYSEEDGDLYDHPFDTPTSLSAGRYVFEGDAIRVLERYSGDGDEG